MAERAQILPGTLDLLILKAVSLGPLYGYGILLRIEQISHGALLIEQGALYPALFRLVRQRLLKAHWGTSENEAENEAENELEEELRAHIQDRANDLERSGVPRAEAERCARLEFGGYQKFREECREAQGTHFF